MPNSSLLCCDANVVVRLATVAAPSPAWTAWNRWAREGRRVIAPTIISYEVTNARYRMRRVKALDEETMTASLRAAFALPIERRSVDALHERAVALASRFNRPASYDAHDLALAESLDTEFWTLDERLYNAVQHQLSWVHLIEK